jgi:hypothetical protein
VRENGTLISDSGGSLFRRDKAYFKKCNAVTIIIIIITMWSRDSAVGIATGHGLDDRGVTVRVPARV